MHKHKKSHSEERAHPCPLCDKSFKFPYKLTQHMITHTRDRKHACDDCGTCADRRVRAHASRNDATKKKTVKDDVVKLIIITKKSSQRDV